MYRIIEERKKIKKTVAVGLFKQVLHEKTSHGTFSSAFGNSWKVARGEPCLKPQDIQLCAGIRPGTAESMSVLTPSHCCSLFFPRPPTEAPGILVPEDSS